MSLTLSCKRYALQACKAATFPAAEPACSGDTVLAPILIYLCFELAWNQWKAFEECAECSLHPIHKWLLLSAAMLLMVRLGRITCSYFGSFSRGDHINAWASFWKESLVLRSFGQLMRIASLSVELAWATLGLKWWLRANTSASACLPTGMLTVLFVLCQGTGYLRSALACIRFFTASTTTSHRAAISPAVSWSRGVSEVSLANSSVCFAADTTDDASTLECTICLGTVQSGEHMRCLLVCGHTFHGKCIDVWLNRRADCPLCRRPIHPAWE